MKRENVSVRNPLRRRLWRELAGDWKKYGVIALFLIFIIGFVSGMYVANGSMLAETDDAGIKYRREDGNFTLLSKADKDSLKAIEKKEKITIYENFHRDQKESWEGELEGREKLSKKQKNDLKIRVYKLREDIDLPCVMSGRLPEQDDEIALDRMHAENVGIKVGTDIKVGKKKYNVTGLVSNSDYTTLFENSTDTMFDALTFDVGLVTKKGFERLSAPVRYTYSYLHTTKAGNGIQDSEEDQVKQKERADDVIDTVYKEALKTGNSVEDFVPAYANQAIQFAPADFGADEAMGGTVLYVLIAVLAFVFAITINSTITKEAAVIGTLRASGYSRGELVRHYMAAPMIVTLISAVIGNVLGYTFFKKTVVAMYYNSYGLPHFETRLNSEAFIKTTLIPVVIMFVINLLMISLKMRLSPLRFLRRDLKRRKGGRAMHLPSFRFLTRFRLRVMTQNLSGYFMLFIGILAVMIMLAMAVGMPDSLSYYQKKAPDMVLAPHQTMIKSSRDETGELLKTHEKSAEPFAAYELVYRGQSRDEDISAYGISRESAYLTSDTVSDLEKNEILVSRSFADKYDIGKGDKIDLSAKYEHKKYHFTVAGVDPYQAGCAVFMPLYRFRKTFNMEKDEFSGWLSKKEITDVDDKYIANEITVKDITKMTDQLDHSMGDYMLYFQYLCILLAAVLIFLLTKLIIERNENPISMTKILGYTNREIAGIYLNATTIMVILSEIIAVFLAVRIMEIIWKHMIMRMNGWFGFVITKEGIARMMAFVFIGYLIVMLMDFRRIRKVPMDEALKNVE